MGLVMTPGEPLFKRVEFVDEGKTRGVKRFTVFAGGDKIGDLLAHDSLETTTGYVGVARGMSPSFKARDYRGYAPEELERRPKPRVRLPGSRKDLTEQIGRAYQTRFGEKMGPINKLRVRWFLRFKLRDKGAALAYFRPAGK